MSDSEPETESNEFEYSSTEIYLQSSQLTGKFIVIFF